MVTVFQHPGETDVCYIWRGGWLYEVTTEGASVVEPEDGVPLGEYYEAVLAGVEEVSLDFCHPSLVHYIDRLIDPDHRSV